MSRRTAGNFGNDQRRVRSHAAVLAASVSSAAGSNPGRCGSVPDCVASGQVGALF